MTKSYIVDVQENEQGDQFIELPPDMLNEVHWREGDNIDWSENEDGSFLLSKAKETEFVLVECVSTFRQRYVVEVPKGESLWALDTVTMNEASEFSQEYLGEQIVSHRVVSREEILDMCDKDNDYASSWDDQKKFEVFCTAWNEESSE